MTRMHIALATGALILAGTGAAAAQTVIVEPGYGPPGYAVAPAPVYVAPPAPVYVAPAPAYVAPVRPWHRHVVVTERAWAPGPAIVYSDW
jgi:hypothetical protein